MSGQIVFIVWRESVEALLVIGILQAWLSQQARATGAWRYLWGGVGAGVALALVLALGIFELASWLPPDGQDYFMAGMMILAAGLIVQMVFWMRTHGRTLKRRIDEGLAEAHRREHWWIVFLLAMVAVAREGSETVVFLFGLISSGGAQGPIMLYGAIALGFGAAIATYLALQVGGRHVPWRIFFRVTEVILLLLGAALAVSAADKLIALGVLPYASIAWNTSWLLDDSSRLGGLVSALTGYRARPDWVILSVWVLYWVVILMIGMVQRLRPWARRPVES